MLSPQTTECNRSDGAAAGEFTAVVTEVREHSRIDGKPVFQIALDVTEFVPGSLAGAVIGVLLAKARSGAVLEVPITEVSRDESGELWHSTMKPLQPGTAVVGRVAAATDADRGDVPAKL